MKQRFWIILALAALILALGCGAALADTEQTSVFGFVNVSTLPDDADVILTGDTTLNIDVSKQLAAIRGPYSLTVQGEEYLTIDPAYSALFGHAIDVYSFDSTADIRIFPCGKNYDAVHAQYDINVTDAYIYCAAGNIGMVSENGNITLNCHDRSSGQYLTSTVRKGIRAENESVSIMGNVKVSGQEKIGIFAHGDISVINGTQNLLLHQ